MNRFYLIYLITVLLSCTYDKIPEHPYVTENVVIVVMDGPRYSETIGDSSHQFIPHLWNDMRDSGIICTEFYNEGITFTVNGHVALTTGHYQSIDNTGLELPANPSIFQYWIKNHPGNSSKTALICSKDKLEVLGNTSDYRFKNKFNPPSDCGIQGNGSGYRDDSITFNHVMTALTTTKPNLLLVNFKEPDYSGHTGNWSDYLNGIKKIDEYTYQIWQFLNTDNHYKGKTTFIFTNDHGRHLGNGFQHHGDDCTGCRHIFLYAQGPDFKKGMLNTQHASLVDLHATLLQLLHINNSNSEGHVMMPLFKNH